MVPRGARCETAANAAGNKKAFFNLLVFITRKPDLHSPKPTTMNKKILTIILSLALIAGFFLPLTNGSSASAFDFIKAPKPGLSGIGPIVMAYMWIVFPVCGLILLIGALNNNTWVPARALWAIIPILAVIYMLVRPIMDGADAMTMIKGFGIGYWITVGASVLLAVWHPKK